MTSNTIDRLELLFVRVDSQDGSHDVPDIFFPAPKYFARSADRPVKDVLKKQIELDSDAEPKDNSQLKNATILRAAMGRELSESFEKSQWTASMSERAKDEWDRILDSDLM
jgi:hypothetical protein